MFWSPSINLIKYTKYSHTRLEDLNQHHLPRIRPILLVSEYFVWPNLFTSAELSINIVATFPVFPEMPLLNDCTITTDFKIVTL